MRNRLSEAEARLAAEVQRSLEKGLDLYSWWNRSGAEDNFAESVAPESEADTGFFFKDSGLWGSATPVMGSVHEQPFDPSTRSPAKRRISALRAFVFRSLLRVNAESGPAAEVTAERSGFSYSQLLYKPIGGAVARFGEHERREIIDVRTLGNRFEWVLLEVEILERLVLRPFASRWVGIQIRVPNRQLVVLSPELSVDRVSAGGHEYGLGYVMLKNPDDRGLLAHGPGQMDAGLQLFRFHMLDNGEVRSRLVFLTRGLERVLNLRIGFDPVLGSLWLFNALTLGLAERRLGISKRAFEESMLSLHLRQHREMLTIAAEAWHRECDDLANDSAAAERGDL